MDQQHQEDQFFQQLFQDQRKAEEAGAPVFAEIFRKAQNQHRNMKNIKWIIGAVIGLLLLTAFALSTHGKRNAEQEIPIAKAGISLFERLENDGRIVTNDIYFAFDRADLKPESMTIIKDIARMMQEHPEVRLSVEGHSDDLGEENYNQELSALRAAAVRQALIQQSIAPERLTSKGFGESTPVADNGTDEGRAQNRRVEFVRF